MKHAFVMNPLDQVNRFKDTTYFLMLAAQNLGKEVYYVDPDSIFLDHNVVKGYGNKIIIDDGSDNPFCLEQFGKIFLDKMDVVWVRTDPPFDRRYFYVSLLLDYLSKEVKVVNRPSALRNWNEKLAALRYPNLTPLTLMSRNVEDIHHFLSIHKHIVIKPVDGFGGKGICFAKINDSDVVTLLNSVTKNGRHWIIAQEYLPAAKQGDKRILLLDGHPLGAILRLHAEDAELNNLDQGGKALPAKLTENDLEICSNLSKDLVENGIRFAGIDVIGDKLIEINVTSPTGLQEMSRFDKYEYHHQIINAMDQ